MELSIFENQMVFFLIKHSFINSTIFLKKCDDGIDLDYASLKIGFSINISRENGKNEIEVASYMCGDIILLRLNY